MTYKKTLRLYADPDDLDSATSTASLEQAADILRAGGTVAFPTETVYGLGANAFDEAAAAAIFVAKQRPAWDPLIVHIVGEEQLTRVAVNIPPIGRLLMSAFWPGPLTLLLPRSPAIPAIVTAGRPRVGVRAPRHPVARRLIELAGVPIAAPSANSFGKTSPTRAEFVLQDLDGRIDAVIDGGATTLGLESTVVDVCEDPPVLYRPGMVTQRQLEDLCPSLIVYRQDSAAPEAPESLPAPGVGLKHYAPRARLILVDLPDELLTGTNLSGELLRVAAPLQAAGEVVGVMLLDQANTPPGLLGYQWSHWGDEATMARRLFAGLRELDMSGATVILCPLPRESGLGSAMRDRLLKAAR